MIVIIEIALIVFIIGYLIELFLNDRRDN